MSRSAKVLLESSAQGFRAVVEVFKGNYRKERWPTEWARDEDTARVQGVRLAGALGFRPAAAP